MAVLRGWPAAFAAACLVGASACLYWGFRRQPDAFLLEAKYTGPRRSSASRVPAWPWLTMVRWTIGVPALSAVLASVATFGLLQAVLGSRYAEEDETGLFMTPVLVYVLLTWLPAAGKSLHRLGPLPVGRRTMAAFLTLPALGAALAGYGIGLAGDGFQRRAFLVEFQAEPGRVFPLQKSAGPLVRLPAQFFEIAWDGQAPPLRAPWGESYRPWQARILKGARPVLYSPVSTAEATSPEFAAWEIGRALELAYGIRVPHERIRATHIGLDGSGRPVLVRDLRDLVPEPGASRLPLRWAVPPLTVAVCGAAYLLLVGFLFGLRRADIRPWKRTVAADLVLAGLMLGYLFRVPVSFSGLSRGWILGGALSSLVRSAAEATPGGALTWWLLCVVALWGAFRFAAARLERAEILSEPPRRFGF